MALPSRPGSLARARLAARGVRRVRAPLRLRAAHAHLRHAEPAPLCVHVLPRRARPGRRHAAVPHPALHRLGLLQVGPDLPTHVHHESRFGQVHGGCALGKVVPAPHFQGARRRAARLRKDCLCVVAGEWRRDGRVLGAVPALHAQLSRRGALHLHLPVHARLHHRDAHHRRLLLELYRCGGLLRAVRPALHGHRPRGTARHAPAPRRVAGRAHPLRRLRPLQAHARHGTDARHARTHARGPTTYLTSSRTATRPATGRRACLSSASRPCTSCAASRCTRGRGPRWCLAPIGRATGTGSTSSRRTHGRGTPRRGCFPR
mmetsp:Transcript_24092/g.79302  ORF Transcript_24092/g.79302 Transcript_24092/m.79302 type:complete len:318 (-) Transcript_24092:465-1418(-)